MYDIDSHMDKVSLVTTDKCITTRAQRERSACKYHNSVCCKPSYTALL